MKIAVKVKPNAKQQTLQQLEDGSWVARLKSPPIDGKANAELIALLAATFGVPKTRVCIKAGKTGRLKHVEIEMQQSSSAALDRSP